MRSWMVVGAAILALTLPSQSRADDACQFVSMFIRQLNGVERIRETAETASKLPNANPFLDCIHNSERFQLELRTQISVIQKFKLRKPFDDLPVNIARFYQNKLEVWDGLSQICSAFVGGEKPGVNYDQLGAQMPKLRAHLEFGPILAGAPQ